MKGFSPSSEGGEKGFARRLRGREGEFEKREGEEVPKGLGTEGLKEEEETGKEGVGFGPKIDQELEGKGTVLWGAKDEEEEE